MTPTMLIKDLRGLKEASGLTVREISRRMGLAEGHQAVVQRLVTVKNPPNMTLRTLLRFAKACGYDVEIVFKKQTRR
jgi:transcriptional regulator with XRE-family HTH domain